MRGAKGSTAGGIRTHNLLGRNQTRYPLRHCGTAHECGGGWLYCQMEMQMQMQMQMQMEMMMEMPMSMRMQMQMQSSACAGIALGMRHPRSVAPVA